MRCRAWPDALSRAPTLEGHGIHGYHWHRFSCRVRLREVCGGFNGRSRDVGVMLT
jgi:hypothetical protein